MHCLPASAPQRVIVKFLAGLGAVMVLTMVCTGLGLPALSVLLETGGAMVTQGFLMSVRFCADSYALLAAALGVLWSGSVARRAAAKAALEFDVAKDGAGMALLLVLLVLYYAQIERVVPAGASGIQLAATYAGLCAALFPFMAYTVLVYEEEDADSASVIVVVVVGCVCVFAVLITAGLTGTESSVVTNGNSEKVHVLNVDAILGHLAAILASVGAAYRYVHVLRRSSPNPSQADAEDEGKAHTCASVARTEQPGSTLVEESWEQRWSRQRALRDAERRQREQGK